MNSCNFIGRLTRDPEVRYSQGEKPVCVARFTLAVDRPTKKGNEREADFLTFKALGGRGEFVEKHLKKGMRIGICARAESGSYEKNIIQNLSVKALHSAMGSRGTPARQQEAIWSRLRIMKGSHSIRRC